jgi:phosphodiesterase/alkaline phosphatase D-like protein
MWKLNWINHVIFGVVILLLAAGCKKEEISSDKEYPITHWPIAKALEVTNKTDTTAKLNGTVNSFGLPTTVTFEYGTTTSYGRTVSAYQIPVSGSGIIEVSANISGLTTDTIYHFRVGAENSFIQN